MWVREYYLTKGEGWGKRGGYGLRRDVSRSWVEGYASGRAGFGGGVGHDAEPTHILLGAQSRWALQAINGSVVGITVVVVLAVSHSGGTAIPIALQALTASAVAVC